MIWTRDRSGSVKQLVEREVERRWLRYHRQDSLHQNGRWWAERRQGRMAEQEVNIISSPAGYIVSLKTSRYNLRGWLAKTGDLSGRKWG